MSEPDNTSQAREGNEVFKVALTGGPCAGKTSCMAVLTDYFEKRGWKVYRVPETASILLGGGVLFPEMNEAQQDDFQEQLLLMMMKLEDTYTRLGELSDMHNKTIVICDRGTMDCCAYTRPAYWSDILARHKLTNVELRDARYDCVIHLVTAAYGAESFYTVDNNAVRLEGISLARELDDKVANNWLGHPYMTRIDNATGFAEKMQRVVEAISKHLSVDEGERADAQTPAKKHKFIVTKWPEEFPVPVRDFDVVHDYLSTQATNEQARIRRRGEHGSYSYTHTVRRVINDENVEVRRSIRGREYLSLLAQRDPMRASCTKTRRCFYYNGLYYQLDIFKAPEWCTGLAMLEVYTHQADALLIPDFLEVKEEVTGVESYSMFNLCRVRI